MKTEIITNQTKIQLSSKLYASEIAAEVVILEITEGVYYGLNKMGAIIYDYVKEPIVVGELCRLLAEKYDPGSADIEAMVLEFVRELLVAKIITVVD